MLLLCVTRVTLPSLNLKQSKAALMIMTMSHFTVIGLSVICISLQCICIEHIKFDFFFMMKRLKWPPVNVILSVLNTSTRTHNIKANRATCDEFVHIENVRSCTTKNSKRWEIITFSNLFVQANLNSWDFISISVAFSRCTRMHEQSSFISEYFLYNSLWKATGMLPWLNHSTIKSLINVKKSSIRCYKERLMTAMSHLKDEWMDRDMRAWVRVVQCACFDFSSLKCTAIKIYKETL